MSKVRSNPSVLMHEKNAPIKSIAIIGSSYAGLAFANFIQTRSTISIRIFEALDVPRIGVLVGDVYIPSGEEAFAQLGLKWRWPKNVHLVPEEELLASLRGKLLEKICNEIRVLDLELTQDGIYLNVRSRQCNKNYCLREGPFDLVVAANGVRSTFRNCNIASVAVIGDSRWVQNRWWDFGTRRLQQGADIAIRDALKLGAIVLNHIKSVDCENLVLGEFSSGMKKSVFVRNAVTVIWALLAIIAISPSTFSKTNTTGRYEYKYY